MKIANYFVLIGTGLVMFPLQSLAVDLPMRQTPPPTPVAEGCFSSFSAWIQTSAAECPLSYAGVTLYGTVDAGYGYETNGAKFNAQYPNGVNELVSAVNHGAKWQGTPNALSQSNIGIKWSEPVFSQWNFIGDVRAAFDPYSLRFANGPGALEDNNLTPAFSRSAALDSSLAYGPVNALAYAGLQNPVWGMLTYGRQLTFSGENSLTYDPFGGGYAFSMQGTSGALGGGLGDTEMVRYGHSLKYVYTDDGVRVGVISQLGGWELGNNAKYAAQGDIGFDYQGFSVDGVYSYARDAVSLSIWDDGLFPNTLTAKIENISAFELATKYVWQDFTLFGAYQYDHITNPSVLPRGVNFAHFNDDVTARYGTGVQGGAFPVPRNLQDFWVGGKWSVLPQVDLAVGYYLAWQNDYLGGTQTYKGASASCAHNQHFKGTNSAKCAGSEDAVSGLVDWHATKRIDLYVGTMYSHANKGLAAGYYADTNIATTAGLRVKF